jgi:hypothetical protein
VIKEGRPPKCRCDANPDHQKHALKEIEVIIKPLRLKVVVQAPHQTKGLPLRLAPSLRPIFDGKKGPIDDNNG